MLSPGKVLINGVEECRVDVTDRGFQYGDGVFTTLPVVQSSPICLDQHVQRLRHNAGRLGITSPEHALILDEVTRIAEANGDGVIKIMLTRGRGGRGYGWAGPCQPTRVISWHPAPAYPGELRIKGVLARVCTNRLGINPALAGIKHMNRLEQIIARAEWTDEAIREGLMLDQDGFVVEGVMSNLFAVKDGRLMTPLLDRCGVAGLMRARIIRLARSLDLQTVELRMEPDQVFSADELILSNCIIRLWPIRQLEEKHFNIGPISRSLMKMIDQEEEQCLV